MQRVSCSPENAVKMQRALAQIDVRDLLTQVSVPTLIFHSKDDQVVPFSAGEYLAKHIPGAIFVPMDGENHLLLEKEAAWPSFIRLMRQFLSAEDDELTQAPRPEEVGAHPSYDGAQRL